MILFMKEIIDNKQAISIMSIFIMGSTLLLGTARDAKNDLWIAVIMAMLFALPVLFVYARILTLFKEKDLFDILYIVLGKPLGIVMSLFYIWYAFHLGALVLRNVGEFINISTMPETPMLVPMLLVGVLCIMVVRCGVEVLGRCARFFFPIIILVIILVNLLVIPKLNLNFIKPILYNGFLPVAKGAFSAFSFPFAETVLFTVILFSLNPKKSIYKVYLWSLIIGGSVVLVIGMRNILVLEESIRNAVPFASHLAVERIEVGDFVQRIEVTVAITLVVSVFIKASVCLFAACKGIQKLFGLKDYRVIVVQIGLLMVYFSYIVYENVMQMSDFAHKVYPYYAFPFQVIFPVIILIIAEIRSRLGHFKSLEQEPPKP